MGCFYGFKLHIIANHLGEIVSAKLTAAHVDDRVPVKELAEGLQGQLYGDKSYISQALTAELGKVRFNRHLTPQRAGCCGLP